MANVMTQQVIQSANRPAKADTPTCPRCHQQKNVRRSRRHGFDYMLSFFGFYPYRCQSCMERFRKFGKPPIVAANS